jgi:hypothetical protein
MRGSCGYDEDPPPPIIFFPPFTVRLPRRKAPLAFLNADPPTPIIIFVCAFTIT